MNTIPDCMQTGTDLDVVRVSQLKRVIVSRIPVMLAIAGFLIVFAYGLSWSLMPIRFYLRCRWFPDDAFYYFTVARNLLNGYWLTFDRINTTNGFQPLWMIVCTAVGYFFRAPALFLHAINITQVLFAALTFAVLYTALYVKTNAPIVSFLVLSSLFVFTRFTMMLVSGLETGVCQLAFAFLVLGLFVVEKYGLSPKRCFAIGLAFIGLFFARLDTFVICFFATLFILRLRPTRRELVLLLAPLSLLAAIYCLYNKVEFGRFMPLSGAVKQIWGSIAFRNAVQTGKPYLTVWLDGLLWPASSPDYYCVGIIVLFNAACGLYFWFRCERVLAAIMAAFTTKYLLYIYLFYTYAIFGWYYSIDYLGPVLCVTYVFSRLRLDPTQAGARLFVALPLQCGFACWLVVFTMSNQNSIRQFLNHQLSVFNPTAPAANELDSYYLAARSLNNLNIDKNAIFAAHNSGVLGYFIRYRMVNVDGLINGRRRFAFLQKDGWDFMPYLDRGQHIDAYIDSLPVGAKGDYDKAFITERGFVEIPLTAMVERRFGRGESDSMACYVRPDKWKRTRRAHSGANASM